MDKRHVKIVHQESMKTKLARPTVNRARQVLRARQIVFNSVKITVAVEVVLMIREYLMGVRMPSVNYRHLHGSWRALTNPDVVPNNVSSAHRPGVIVPIVIAIKDYVSSQRQHMDSRKPVYTKNARVAGVATVVMVGVKLARRPCVERRRRRWVIVIRLPCQRHGTFLPGVYFMGIVIP